MRWWLVKAAIQKSLSLLPNSQSWNYLFQKYVTRTAHLSYVFETRVEFCAQHLAHYGNVAQTGQPPSQAVELGTGWHPVVPVGLFLCGVQRIFTFDIVSLLRPENVRGTLSRFLEYAESGTLRPLLPQFREDRLERLRESLNDPGAHAPVETLHQLGIEVIVRDAQDTGLPADSVDLFVSNTTLEHIPPRTLVGIFQEFHRIAVRSAIMSHLIDMSDHYSHFDRRLSPYNYLRYSDGVWRFFNNSLQFQNRLRLSDYRKMLDDTGFELRSEDNRQGSSQELGRIRIAPQFREYPAEDLLTTHSWMVSICRK